MDRPALCPPAGGRTPEPRCGIRSTIGQQAAAKAPEPRAYARYGEILDNQTWTVMLVDNAKKPAEAAAGT